MSEGRSWGTPWSDLDCSARDEDKRYIHEWRSWIEQKNSFEIKSSDISINKSDSWTVREIKMGGIVYKTEKEILKIERKWFSKIENSEIAPSSWSINQISQEFCASQCLV